jgi:nucleoside-diphosphate-sugar epimerase
MRVLFIGGTGNISSAVSELAIKKKIELIHINRGTNNKMDSVVTYVTDINNIEKVKKFIGDQEFDCVVNWIAFTPSDIERDYNLFKEKTKHYIFISSATVYQKPPVSYIITEDNPLGNPYWDYARNKIACENLLMKYYREHNFPATIVRPSHTYNTVIPVAIGGWTEYTIIDRIKKGLPIIVHGDGTSLWTITHSNDFAKGLLGLIENESSIGEAFHITSDEVFTWNQIYTIVANAIGQEPNIVHIASDYIADYADTNGYPSLRGTLLGDKSYSKVFNNSKIKKYVDGYKAEIPFQKGIKDTIEWFEQYSKRMIINNITNLFIDNLLKTYQKK